MYIGEQKKEKIEKLGFLVQVHPNQKEKKMLGK